MAIPFVMIDLDKPRRLRFGMGAMVEFEQVTGTKLMDIDGPLSVEATCQALWVMLRQDDPELTFDGVCRLVDDNASGITEVISKTAEAISAALGGGESPNAKTPTAKKARQNS